jgi:replicative DNA helicase
VERIDELYHREGDSDVTGVPTGFSDLDRMTSGLQPGDLVIVAGRPSMGKTSFSMNIGEYVAIEQGLPVAVFSMEMGAVQLAQRIIGSVGLLDQHRMRTGKLTAEDWPRLTHAVQRVQEAQLYIDESPALSPNEVRARARRLARQCGQLGLIIIDYLQLMSGSGGGENRATEISEISRSLKGLAKELNCPLIALSQLNRSLEQRPNKRPVMSDLRESGAIEQDADVILFIYRDEVYNPDSPDKGTAEIIIGKQRNGPIGTVRLTFQGSSTRFLNFTSAVS